MDYTCFKDINMVSSNTEQAYERIKASVQLDLIKTHFIITDNKGGLYE